MVLFRKEGTRSFLMNLTNIRFSSINPKDHNVFLQDICQAYDGGYLAELETKDESDYLETLAKQTGKGMYLYLCCQYVLCNQKMPNSS